jgi:TetR/AcrR family transcriptional regulator, cholesterol catabolism regulator
MNGKISGPETLVTKKVSVVLLPIMTDFDIGIRIREKAHDLFMQFGLRSVSMDDIATALGMSKKTIYQYYADKDELIGAVIEREIQHTQSICEADRDTSSNAIHEVWMAMEMVVEMFGSMNPSLLYDMEKYHPKAFLKFQKHKNDYLYNIIRENMQRGIREELYRPEIKVDILSRYRIETMMLPFHSEFQNKLKSNLAELEEEFILHFLYGLVTPKGYKLIQKYQQDRKKLVR